MGLLDSLTNMSPEQTQGLLGLASQMLQASGPSTRPVSFGQALGAGLEGYQAGSERERLRRIREQEAAQMAKYRGLQMQDIESEIAARQAKMNAPVMEEYSTDPRVGVDKNTGEAFTYLISKTGNKKILEGVLPRDKQENINGVWQNPYARRDGEIAPQDVNQPFVMGANGQPVANTAYQSYQIGKARAGAPSITTKVENKAGESIAAQVGPILKESATAAEGAIGQIDAANRIIKTVQDNKIFAGPLASKRLSFAQLGQTLGVGGKDEAEMIANTRQVVRGFAELTLEGRKMMSGQGQITNQESSLAEKAISGDIDGLTPAEILIVANASKRVGEHKLRSHQSKVSKARSNPATAGIADYFDTPAYAPTPPGATSQFSVTAPNGKTYTFPDAKSLANFKLKAGIR